jgi:type I restriction-modification system DNA methylase subunit
VVDDFRQDGWLTRSQADLTLLTPNSIKAPLRACGYRNDLLRTDFLFGENQSVPLVTFAQPPADSRSACVAVLSDTWGARTAVEACRPLGAPVVFVCFHNTLQWWKQGASKAEYLETIPAANVEAFFSRNLNTFSPDAVYRAKTWGRFQTEYQLSFVDMGLMPMVEEQVGKSLGRLIERNVSELKEWLGWEGVTSEQGRWLLETVFWLVSAKILRDKQVQAFADLDLNDVEEVFRRVGDHYGTEPLVAGSKKKLEALGKSARIVSQYSSLVLTTTEALAYVYENTLISKATRSALGTHSTPPFLVDYVVGKLADWVREIPVYERSVFEPACGHAAFLVSAMRLLTELLPAEKAVSSRRGPYLRSRLHGTDIDPFALDLARLSLTLTDIPNPDGWDLSAQDMFVGDRLSAQAKKSTILLANPPFDNFTKLEQRVYRDKMSDVHSFNKSAEVLWRTLPQLPEGAVFGVVIPQTILHSDNARDLREFLVSKCELRDICLFPDKVFSFSDAESAVLVGRRKRVGEDHKVRYLRVRERELPSFHASYLGQNARTVPQSRFSVDGLLSLRLPELEEVWIALADNPTLMDAAVLGKGLEYKGRDLPRGSVTYATKRFDGSQPGFVRFDASVQLNRLPTRYWMNLDPSVIRRPGVGTVSGTPQVLLNYARASRSPWRLKALIDKRGHPVTSRFITIRPQASEYSLETIWALLNSPIANAYAYSHLWKRDNIVGDIRRIPVPRGRSFDGVELAATTYLASASTGGDSAKLEDLLLRVDSEVLKLYSLPFDLEQRLLGLFNDWGRIGVPFKQTRYLPKELEGKVRFSDFLEFEENWSVTNRERGALIDKSISGKMNAEERTRLDMLQVYADYHIETVSPRPVQMLDELEKLLFLSPPTNGDDIR